MQSFGAILLIAAYFGYSVTNLLLYLLIDEGIPILLTFGLVNATIVSLLLLRFVFVKNKLVKPKRLKYIFFRALTGVIFSLTYYIALTYASFAEVGVLTNSFPLFIVMIAWFFLGEQVSTLQWIALLLGLTGVWVILAPNVGNIFNGGMIFATTASIFWAISLIIMQKIADYEDVYTYLFYFYSFSLLLVLPFILGSFHQVTGKQLFFSVVAALLSLLSQSLIFQSYKVCSAAELAPYNFSFAFFHFLLAKGIFAFSPTLHFYIGAGLIFLGGVINLIIFERKGAESRIESVDSDQLE